MAADNATAQQAANPALAALRDIHASPEAPWWPPAPGWWLLALLLLLGLAWLARLVWRRWRRRQLLRAVHQLLEEALASSADDPRLALASLNQALKRVAVYHHGRARVAGLSGRDWLAYLDAEAPGDLGPPPEVLLQGPWQPAPAIDDTMNLARWSRRWVDAHV